MRKCIIMPDSFKGTLSAIEICDIMKMAVLKRFPSCQVHAVPVADGGEGTVDCFLYATDAKKTPVTTTGPYGEKLDVYYARTGSTAIIEMACAAGLPLVEKNPNPCKTTTYGVGTIIRHAVETGCKKIVLGLGGSCTNDGGAGVACALGTVFYNSRKEAFIPTGDTLSEIVSIDIAPTQKLLQGVEITAMCDIDNPMHGIKGAAHIFGPQKGADADMVQLLDENLAALDKVIRSGLGKDVSNMPGAGAAGALGAGVVAFLGGKLNSGIETVLDLIDFDTLVENTDVLFTGEGQIDSQSIGGKVVIGIAGRAKRKNVPVVAVVGSIGEGAEQAYEYGVNSIFSINTKAMDFEKSRYFSKENLEKTMDSLLRFYTISKTFQ